MHYFLSLIFSILFFQGFACDPTSRVHIQRHNFQSFIVVVDGKEYSGLSHDFNISFLPGPHYLIVKDHSSVIICQGLLDVPAASEMFLIADPLGFRMVGSRRIHACNSCETPIVDHRSELVYFKNLIIRTPSVPEKLKLIKRFIASNELRSGQIAGMLDLLEAEKHKMELAQYAYPFTADLENYDIVAESLVLESSKKELRLWLKAKSEEQKGS